ncbi:DUF927 domain-containing protein [Acetobacter orientalis]|uniref:DUF927 domain-containing protein n=1 Tax=Acetobacter orientalis TaxID=146474 RepID=UPI00386D12F2
MTQHSKKRRRTHFPVNLEREDEGTHRLACARTVVSITGKYTLKATDEQPAGCSGEQYLYRNNASRLLAFVSVLPDGRKETRYHCECSDGDAVSTGWYRQEEILPRPPRFLYGLDKLAASQDKPVVLVDTEGLVERAQALFSEAVIVSMMSGAGCVNVEPLEGREVYLLGHDIDEAGRALTGYCASLKVLNCFLENLSSNSGAGLWSTLQQDAFDYVDPGATVFKAGYEMRPDGLYYVRRNEEGEIISETETPIASPFKMLSNIEFEESSDTVYYKRIRFLDTLSGKHSYKNYSFALHEKAADVIKDLRKFGMTIDSEHEKKFESFMSTVQAGGDNAIGFKKAGWREANGHSVFLLPNGEVVGSAMGRREYVPVLDSAGSDRFKQRGTLEEWQQNVARHAKKNHNLMLVLCAAFASPLIKFRESFKSLGGFHFVGSSSIGKSTLLTAAASVWGPGRGGTDGQVRSWKSTGNAFENTAEASSDTFLALDELGQAPARTIGETVYALANGVGKERMYSDTKSRKVKEWNLMFVSSGEKTLEEMMASAGQVMKGGQELRFTNIEADAGAGFGVFNELNGFASSRDFAERMNANAAKYYGTAARCFLKRLAADAESGRIKELIELYEGMSIFHGFELNEDEVKIGQLARAKNKFMLAAIAGELAIEYGVLPFEQCDALKSCGKMMREWIKKNNVTSTSEEKQALDAISNYLLVNGSQFQNINGPDGEEGNLRIIRDLNGYYEETEIDGRYYHIFTDVFKKKICAANSINVDYALKMLTDKGLLITSNDGDNVKRFTNRISAKNECFERKRMRVYTITDKISDPDYFG